MTWVIGASSILGYGVLLSDVQVTLADGSTADLVKKAYPVGPFLGAGFAGSVFIGFRLVQSLRDHLMVPVETASKQAWEPQTIARYWASIAADIFASSPERERRLGTQVLLVGVSPNENLGVPEFSRVYLIRFAHPHFRPVFMCKGLQVCHIGSGARTKLYTRSLKEFFRFPGAGLNTEMAGPTGWPGALGHGVGRIISEHPTRGVSRHVHILVCRLSEIFEMKNDERIFPKDGDPIEMKMPPVAASYASFCTRCEGLKVGAEGAIA